MIVEPVDDDKALAELRSAAARHGGEQEAARRGPHPLGPVQGPQGSAPSRHANTRSPTARPPSATPGSSWSPSPTAPGQRPDAALRKAVAAPLPQRGRVLLRPLWGRMELGFAAALPLGLGLSREPF